MQAAMGPGTWAQRYVAAPTAAIVVSAEGVFGALQARLLLGEQTSALGLFGAGLILCAIALAALGDRGQPMPARKGPQAQTAPPGSIS